MTSRERVKRAIRFERPDVPIENVEAMFAAFRKYGTYDDA